MALAERVIHAPGPWQHRDVSANGARFHVVDVLAVDDVRGGVAAQVDEDEVDPADACGVVSAGGSRDGVLREPELEDGCFVRVHTPMRRQAP